jgi:hypothetical protein
MRRATGHLVLTAHEMTANDVMAAFQRDGLLSTHVTFDTSKAGLW